MGEKEDNHADPPLSFEELQDTVRASTGRHVRQLTTLIVTFLYLLITVAATTDLQLLLPDSRVSLPIVDVKIPLFGFFIVAPLLALIVHFNVLLNLLDHARKLKSWRSVASEEQLTMMPGAIVNYPYVFPKRTFNYWLVRLLQVLMLCFGPLLVLLFVQIRFADYHDIWMTAWHLFLIALDVFILFVYWFRIAYPDYLEPQYDRFWHFLRAFLFKRKNLSILLGYIPCFLVMMILSIGCVGIVYQIIGNHNIYSWMYIPRLDVAEATLVSKPPSDAIINGYLNQGKTVEQAWTDHATGIDLRGRDLNYARLDYCKIINGQLDSIKLNHASLILTDLNGAKLFMAELNGANLKWADLNGAHLLFVELNGAILQEAKLNNADLFYAILNGAILNKAELNGTDLFGAELNGAYMKDAKLNGAGLRWTELNGTNLSGAELTGAYLEETELNGTYIEGTHFRGAVVDTSSVSMTGIYFGTSIDVDSIPSWNQILMDSASISAGWYRNRFIFRINSADSLVNADSTGRLEDIFVSDSTEFMNFRKRLICKGNWTFHETWIAQGLLIQSYIDTVCGLTTDILLEEMYMNCRDSIGIVYDHLKEIDWDNYKYEEIGDSLILEIDRFLNEKKAEEDSLKAGR